MQNFHSLLVEIEEKNQIKTVKQLQDLFKIRTRMLEIKTNMRGNHNEFNCDKFRILGNKNEETQEHILNCPVINAGKEMKMDMNYSDIFSRNVLNQIDITKKSCKIWQSENNLNKLMNTHNIEYHNEWTK